MNEAQKWLLEKECDDLVINDGHLIKHGRWYYVSDAMEEFAKWAVEEAISDYEDGTP